MSMIGPYIKGIRFPINSTKTQAPKSDGTGDPHFVYTPIFKEPNEIIYKFPPSEVPDIKQPSFVDGFIDGLFAGSGMGATSTK